MTLAPPVIPSSPSRGEIFARVSEIIRQQTELDRPLTESTHILSELKLDSILQLSLVVALENDFEICFDPEDEATISTLGSIVAIIDRRLQEKRVEGASGDQP